MNSFRLKPSLTAGGESPLDIALVGGDRVEDAVVCEEVDEAAGYRRRGRDRIGDHHLPFLLAGFLIDRVEAPIRASDIDNAVRDGGRRNDRAAGLESPFNIIQ